jgi:hypothetical protein
MDAHTVDTRMRRRERARNDAPGPVDPADRTCGGRTLWETRAEWEHERELDLQADAAMSAGDDGLEPAAQQEPHPLAETQMLALTVGLSEQADDALPEEAQEEDEDVVEAEKLTERAVQQSPAGGEWSDGAAGPLEYVSPLAMSVAHYTDAWAHDDVHEDDGGPASNSKMEVRACSCELGFRLRSTEQHAYGRQGQ